MIDMVVDFSQPTESYRALDKGEVETLSIREREKVSIY